MTNTVAAAVSYVDGPAVRRDGNANRLYRIIMADRDRCRYGMSGHVDHGQILA